MVTLNSKSRNKANASINKMLDKYGHDCTIIVSDTFPTPVDAKVLFTNYDLAFAAGTIIINTNYKLLVKAVTLPAMLAPLTKIIVNGVELTALTVKKLTPDGTNAIVWEIEAAGTVLPDDVNGISTPTVTAPANNTSYYTSTEGTGGWSIACQGSAPNTQGNAIFTTSEWQIATDEAFTTVVASVTIGGTYWVTDAVLERSTNYYVRTRYNTDVAITSAWSAYSLFSLDEINTGPVTHITKPSILNTVDGAGKLLMDYNGDDAVLGKYPYATTNLANVVLTASDYAPVSAGAFASIKFQIASDAGFTTLLTDITQSEGYGYDPDNGSVWGVTQSYISQHYVFSRGATYYARVKYTSADPYESEWSDTFTFIVDLANT